MVMVEILIACILSAILYRCGGVGKPYNTKYRDMGCPTILLLAVFVVYGKFSLLPYLLTFGLSFGALTTYWKQDEKNNFYWHGLGCGIAGLPLMFVIPWWILIIRLVICTAGIGLWSKLINNDILEECGRGVFFIL